MDPGDVKPQQAPEPVAVTHEVEAVDSRSVTPAAPAAPVAPMPTSAGPEEPEGSPEVSDVDVMLSMLAAEHRQGDPTARWAGSLDDKATRFGVMAGGAVLIATIGFLLLTLLGAIF